MNRIKKCRRSWERAGVWIGNLSRNYLRSEIVLIFVKGIENASVDAGFTICWDVL